MQINCQQPTDVRGQPEDISSTVKRPPPRQEPAARLVAELPKQPFGSRALFPRARGSRPSESKSLCGGESSAALGHAVTAPLALGQRFPCVTGLMSHGQDCTEQHSRSPGGEGRAGGEWGADFPPLSPPLHESNYKQILGVATTFRLSQESDLSGPSQPRPYCDSEAQPQPPASEPLFTNGKSQRN